MKRAKNIVYWLAVGLLVLLIAAFTVPKLFGVQYRAIITGSMEPELPVGALVVIVPTAFENIQAGDDIAFVMNEDLTVVTHRVASVNEAEQSFVTRGIANEVDDINPVRYENTLGKVAFSAKGLGYVISWLDPLPNKIIAVCAIAALVAVSLLFSGKPRHKET